MKAKEQVEKEFRAELAAFMRKWKADISIAWTDYECAHLEATLVGLYEGSTRHESIVIDLGDQVGPD